MRGRPPSFGEAKKLLRRWSRASFPTRKKSALYHAGKHGEDDLWSYLRRAYAFRKRGARRRVLDDGAIRYRRTNGEFLIEKDGKIVSYGRNSS